MKNSTLGSSLPRGQGLGEGFLSSLLGTRARAGKRVAPDLQAWLPAVHKAQGRVRAGHGDAGVGGRHDGHSGQGHPAV